MRMLQLDYPKALHQILGRLHKFLLKNSAIETAGLMKGAREFGFPDAGRMLAWRTRKRYHRGQRALRVREFLWMTRPNILFPTRRLRRASPGARSHPLCLLTNRDCSRSLGLRRIKRSG